MQRYSTRTESIRRLGQVRDFEQTRVVTVRKSGSHAGGGFAPCGSLKTALRVAHSTRVVLFRLCDLHTRGSKQSNMSGTARAATPTDFWSRWRLSFRALWLSKSPKRPRLPGESTRPTLVRAWPGRRGIAPPLPLSVPDSRNSLDRDRAGSAVGRAVSRYASASSLGANARRQRRFRSGNCQQTRS